MELETGGGKLGLTHSLQAVDEMHEWLLQGNDSAATPPPPYGRKNCTRSSTSPPTQIGVKVKPRLTGGVPRHVAEQCEYERKFMDLAFIVIEPFSKERMEWDEGEASPSPLQPLTQWPRTKRRKVRFNPRRIESTDEDSPSPRIKKDQSESKQDGSALKSPEPPSAEEGGVASEAAFTEEDRPKQTTTETSVFRRLGQRAPQVPSPSTDRFPDFRGCITREILFGGLRPIPSDGRDPHTDRVSTVGGAPNPERPPAAAGGTSRGPAATG